MTASLPLDALQRWMLTTITHPAGVAAGATSQSIGEIVLPSRQQSAAERLAIYSSAYYSRLLEVLNDLFPCLRSSLGEELFAQFAVAYLQQYPPTSYTLHHLANYFAEFLDATRPADDAAAEFVVDLARLEHAIDLVFDDVGPENVTAPIEPAAGNRPLPLVPGLRLLTFRFPVSTYFTAWKAGHSPSWPQHEEQFVALFRREYVVRRHELTRPQFDLLTHLVTGKTLEQSLAAIAALSNHDNLVANVEGWFADWSASGFFLAGR